MGTDRFKPLLDREFLLAELYLEFEDYKAQGLDAGLREQLGQWSRRKLTRETQAEAAFVQRFFVDLWGYQLDGGAGSSFEIHPRFRIAMAGQGGGMGEADLALGRFGPDRPSIPQVLCEFKGIGADLDAPQSRKGNTRSPVLQARDYLWNARRGLWGGEPVQPRFAIVTNMDEFRLYWWEGFPDRYIRFKVATGDLFNPVALVDDTERGCFDRFLFQRLFRPDMLLSEAGRTRFERLVEKQGKAARKLEGEFYEDYRRYREALIAQIMTQRPPGVTRSGAVRLAQKLLDRLIFVMFAEDMGQRVGFPTRELQAQLARFSSDGLLENSGQEVWERLKLIFRRMNTGGKLGDHILHEFNGGLFADDPAIDALKLPNFLFVRRGQAQNPASAAEHKATLYYLASTYDFAREGDAQKSIGLYTLGHIFEQSIVELEVLEAKAEERTSLAEVTKRKRDGVYYTPEWVVRRIIEETIDPLFARWRAEAGWSNDAEPSAAAALAYWTRLQTIRVIDPACGSGAFLIVALRHLEAEFARAVEVCRQKEALPNPPGKAEITELILSRNLWGVDINPASVEITKLSLWLHTAQPKRPLSALDHTIQCGNSLIDSRFYGKRRLDDAEERDRINTFDWEDDFALGSFDAVIGNPPYVKLQNFVQVHADMAAWLSAGSTGEAPYLSTRTGNWDLYLPFIEKGLTLLNAGGRMGYIAPSLWPTLDYGEGLRGLVHAGQHLEKWIDFRSFQVFEEATVYTAIQIFSKAPAGELRLAFAGDGDISRVDWSDDDHRLRYEEIKSPLQPWLLAPAPVKALIERLGREGTPLGDDQNTSGIIVGIQTSADHIYHMRRLGPDLYAYTPQEKQLVKGKVKTVKLEPRVVSIEDRIMKPLVSGRDVKRFREPCTTTYLLFPYSVEGGIARIFKPEEMEELFPNAWRYLKQFESELRNRDGGKTNSDVKWYGYVYPKNLDKQEIVKILVPRLVSRLACVVDDNGVFYCDNVDVGGVVPKRREDVYFLAGILNSPVTNTIFSWISKPFRGDYRSANKQFLTPLPIPNADRQARASLSALARGLQRLRTEQVGEQSELAERLNLLARSTRGLHELLPGVRSLAQIEEAAPRSVKPGDRKGWIDEQRAGDEESALARLDGLIRLDSSFEVMQDRRKLSLLVDGVEAARLFVSEAEAELIEAQWRAVAIDFAPAGKGDGKRLTDRLRRIAIDAPEAVREQVIEIGRALGQRDLRLREYERTLHELTCRLFNLTKEERELVERGR